MIRRGLIVSIVAAPIVIAGCRADDGTSGGAVAGTGASTSASMAMPSTTAPRADSDRAFTGDATATPDSTTDTVPPVATAATAAPVTAPVTVPVAATADSDGAVACTVAAVTPGVSEIVVTGGGADHSVRVFVPSSFDGTALPAVLNWHGLGSNGVEHAAYSGYEALAEEQSFLVVHPTGVGPAGGPTSWQLAADVTDVTDVAAAGARDDVAFAAALIDVLVASWCADPTRIYSTGMSNGGYFTARLLCELSDRIAAGVSVAGLYHPEACAPGRPLPLLAFHGTDDPIVPYEGGESALVGDDVPPDLRALFDRSIRDEYERFVVGNGCDTVALDTFVDSEVVIHSYDGCDGDLTMALFEVTGGGHTWPGSPLRDLAGDPLGFTTGSVEATRDGWVYMREFSLP